MSQVKKSFSSEKFEVSQIVTIEHDGERLDQFIMRYISSISREQVKRKISDGEIIISGRKAKHKPNTRIKVGDEVLIIAYRKDMEDDYWPLGEIEKEEPKIIFEDDDILVVFKPPFIATHPTGKHLFDCVTVFFEQDQTRKLHSVHRLDRETSGVLLLAKNIKAASFYTEVFENKKAQKTYLLLAHKKKQLTFPFTAKERMAHEDDFIPRVFVHCYDENSSKGKSAQTHFELISENDKYVVVTASPKTGRQHQIRAHAYHHGFPLVGDKLYSFEPEVFMRFKDKLASPDDAHRMEMTRQALHADKLEIPKIGGGMHCFVSPLPMDMKNWLKGKKLSL